VPRVAANAQVQEVQEVHPTWGPSGGSYGREVVLALLCLYCKLLSRGCVHLSLICVLSAAETHLTTLNFMNTGSNPFAESVTVSSLFRAWTNIWETVGCSSHFAT